MNKIDEILGQANIDFNKSIVSIVEEKIHDIQWNNTTELSTWDWVLPEQLQKGDPRPALMFWILSIAQAFKFWTRNPDGTVEKYFYEGLSGSNAMFTALRNEWGTFHTPLVLRKINKSHSWFTGAFNSPPDAQLRLDILNEILEGDKLEQAAFYFIEQAKIGTITVDNAHWLTQQFPLAYGNDNYYKKAQLACSAVAGFLSQRGYVITVKLTAMADYQVPRVLHRLGILRYSEKLLKDINEGRLIPEKSSEENAIRAATILACEKISEIYNLPAAVIDNALWASQEIAGNDRFHLTETMNY